MVLQKYVPWVPKDPSTHRVFGALQTLAIQRQRNLFGMVSLRHPVKKMRSLVTFNTAGIQKAVMNWIT